MKTPYSTIAIIYNPNSTGRSRMRAESVAADLKKAAKGVRIRVRASKRRGHMENIAYRTALLNRHALVVAVSGDGGYNEVVNGVLRAQKRGRRVTAGLIPAGNANDHYAGTHRGDFVARVVAGDEDRIDVLDVSGLSGRRPLRRFGHSYAGIGLTPKAGERLNQTRLNPWQEVKIIANVLTHMKSTPVIVDGAISRYDSLIMSNIGRMSKVVRLSKKASAYDGLFEVSHLYDHNKIRLMGGLARAALFGLEADAQTDSFEFETVRATKMQIDGEIVQFDAGSRVRVAARHEYLRCIV